MDKLKELKRNFVYKYHPYKFLGESHGGPIQFEKDLNELLSEYARQEKKQNAVDFVKDCYIPMTPIVVDGYKKTVERIEKRYEEWINQQEEKP